MARHASDREQGALGYKSLFLGACALLTLLVPGVVGYIISHINDTDKAQWRQLKDNHDEYEELRSTYDRLEVEIREKQADLRKDVDALEVRITASEHRGERR